ncbi:holin [Streptomyces sp. HU2014]|uniref:holin n=1 Tax=Streptomyces sp. HU2014 TaxID=2939414 RepID=UPI002010799C|nr:holin [Streptomyces sp. HU2014]UQI44691.1 holin [Streptomyces sp. HU2014]
MPKVLIDVLERTLAAYLTTFLGLLLADGFDLTDVSALKAAAIAAVPAALSVIKGAIGTRFGDRTSAAWLPGKKSSGRKGTGAKRTGKRAGANTPAKKTAAKRSPAKKAPAAKTAAKTAAKKTSAPAPTKETP